MCLAATVAGLSVAFAAPATDGGAVPVIRVAPMATIRGEIEATGARAVLLNVWATWCDPCREELPDLLRYYRDNRARGLRLILISADDEDRREEVRSVLSAAAMAAGLGAEFDAPAFIKGDDDTTFINGLDSKWSGALPATFLYNGRGERKHSWLGPVTYKDVDTRTGLLLTETSSTGKTKGKSKANAKGRER